MNKNIAAITVTLLLAGCANSAGQYADAASTQWQKMTAANKAARPELERCAHGKKPSEIPRTEFVKYMVCFNNVEEAKVLPVVNYPDLYQRVMATRTENASLYSQGKIDFEQFKSRSKMALLAFVEEGTKRDENAINYYAAKDQEENDEIARGLASFKQPPTTRTSCFSTGMATNCTSRTSNY